LVQRCGLHLDQPLVQPRLRRSYFEHLGLDAELVARPYRPWPTELLEAEAEDPTGRLEVTLDQEPHGRGSGMPTARCQSPEYAVACCLLVEMKGLWIELGCEGLDPLLLDSQPPRRAEGLPHCIVLEIPLGHSRNLLPRRKACGPFYLNGEPRAATS
jgi:hypothetical protein